MVGQRHQFTHTGFGLLLWAGGVAFEELAREGERATVFSGSLGFNPSFVRPGRPPFQENIGARRAVPLTLGLEWLVLNCRTALEVFSPMV